MSRRTDPLIKNPDPDAFPSPPESDGTELLVTSVSSEPEVLILSATVEPSPPLLNPMPEPVVIVLPEEQYPTAFYKAAGIGHCGVCKELKRTKKGRVVFCPKGKSVEECPILKAEALKHAVQQI